VANRQRFKFYVNTLAAVKLDVSGEKLLVLKKKYRDSDSVGPVDVSTVGSVAATNLSSKFHAKVSRNFWHESF